MERILEKIYLFIGVLIFLIILGSPYIIRTGFSFFEEELVEGIFIFFSLLLGFFVFSLYKKELKKREDKLDDSFLYIGRMNVQFQEMAEAFSKIEDYPIHKGKFREARKFLLDKILGIVNVDWVMFRIVDIKQGRTIKEDAAARGEANMTKHEISNRRLLDKDIIEGCAVISSDNNNLNINTFCIMPKTDLDDNQILMIKFIVKQLEQLFLFFSFINNGDDTRQKYFVLQDKN